MLSVSIELIRYLKFNKHFSKSCIGIKGKVILKGLLLAYKLQYFFSGRA